MQYWVLTVAKPTHQCWVDCKHASHALPHGTNFEKAYRVEGQSQLWGLPTLDEMASA